MDRTIMIVDDERDLVRALEFSLKREGYRCCSAGSGEQALERLGRSPLPDLILLDLMLPDMSGFDLCRHLRSRRETRRIPVMMLTAKADEVDRVTGFEVGADDYVVKPFFTSELILRIQAVLRRLNAPEEVRNENSFGCLRMNRDAHQVWVGEGEVTLTPMEFRLLEVLWERKGRVQSRAMLLDAVWGIRSDVRSRTVDVHVNHLLDKLTTAGVYIETLHGLGYRFLAAPPEEG